MKHLLEAFSRVVLFALILLLWIWVIDQRFSSRVNLSIIVGGMLLVFPLVWIGRRMLDKNPTSGRIVSATMFVHYAVICLSGVSVARAMVTHKEWPGWAIPIPTELGLGLVIVTGAASLFAVANLALKGFGAPFAIALSRRLTTDWMYAWTRNPMVLATLLLFVSLGIWFQSGFFLLGVLFLVVPALLFVVKMFEERELEIRFGGSYMENKSRTPMLFPRKPKRRNTIQFR